MNMKKVLVINGSRSMLLMKTVSSLPKNMFVIPTGQSEKLHRQRDICLIRLSMK